MIPIGIEIYNAVKENKKKNREFSLFKALIKLFYEESEEFANYFISGFVVSSKNVKKLIEYIKQEQEIEKIPESTKENAINEIIKVFKETLHFISNTKLPISNIEKKVKKLTEQMHYLVIGNYDNFYHMCIEIYARHNNLHPSEILQSWEEIQEVDFEDIDEYLIFLYKEGKTYSEIMNWAKNLGREISRGYIYRRVTDNEKYKIRRRLSKKLEKDITKKIQNLYFNESKTYQEIRVKIREDDKIEVSNGYIYRRITDNDKYSLK